MVYGAGMPFQAARSRRVMPLSAAMRYRFCPRCTVVVTPYLGVDTETGALPVGARRTTWLLPPPASPRQDSASPASAPAFLRTTRPEQRRGGQEVVRKWRSRWSHVHYKKNTH